MKASRHVLYDDRDRTCSHCIGIGVQFRVLVSRWSLRLGAVDPRSRADRSHGLVVPPAVISTADRRIAVARLGLLVTLLHAGVDRDTSLAGTCWVSSSHARALPPQFGRDFSASDVGRQEEGNTRRRQGRTAIAGRAAGLPLDSRLRNRSWGSCTRACSLGLGVG
jgi:hypothetical protein